LEEKEQLPIKLEGKRKEGGGRVDVNYIIIIHSVYTHRCYQNLPQDVVDL
jgi:hypothetical protein